MKTFKEMKQEGEKALRTLSTMCKCNYGAIEGCIGCPFSRHDESGTYCVSLGLEPCNWSYEEANVLDAIAKLDEILEEESVNNVALDQVLYAVEKISAYFDNDTRTTVTNAIKTIQEICSFFGHDCAACTLHVDCLGNATCFALCSVPSEWKVKEID